MRENKDLKDLTWSEKQRYFKEKDKGFSHKGALRKAKTIHTLKNWVREDQNGQYN